MGDYVGTCIHDADELKQQLIQFGAVFTRTLSIRLLTSGVEVFEHELL